MNAHRLIVSCGLFGFLIGSTLQAQTESTVAMVNGLRTELGWRAEKREAYQTTWKSISLHTNPITGDIKLLTNSFIELATGLNVLGRDGKYRPAQTGFQITARGAKATNPIHKVVLAPNIATDGAVHLTSYNGTSVKAHPLGLGWFDPIGYDSNYRLDRNEDGLFAEYDSNGNTLRGETSFDQTADDVYDFENRLIRRTTASGTVEIVYDGDGKRVKQTVGGETTFYLVDDLNPTGYAQVLEEFKDADTTPPAESLRVISRRYAYGHDLLWQDRRESGAWERSYYGYDGHGSMRLLTDANGVITDTYAYDAFGILIEETHPGGAATPNEYLYAGERWDEDLKLYYLRARYADPNTGRFWTRDSFEGNHSDPISLHKYLYAHDDPVNNIDPTGYFSFSSTLGTIPVWGYLAANVGIRAAPAINRATIVLFEATTGNTVLLGGAGAAVALKQGTQMGGVGWSTWQFIGNLLKGKGSKVGTYKELAKVLEKTGEQANHLNQAAAFPNIPYDEGVAAAIQGSTAVKRAAHNLFHQSLEDFWKLFRKNGPRHGDLPTNAEYDAAMRKALEAAGETAENIEALAKLAKEARTAFKYFDGPGGLRPRVPEAIPLPK